jgi:hypothetical protein
VVIPDLPADWAKKAAKQGEPMFIRDSNGEAWEYRRVSSVLERRRISSSVWSTLAPSDYPTMTPDELRHIADVREAK